MIDHQAKQIVKKIVVNNNIMENMFCAPKGLLGRLGGQLMAQDRWLPAWVLDLLEIRAFDAVLEVGPRTGLGLQLAAARAYQATWLASIGLRPYSTWRIAGTAR